MTIGEILGLSPLASANGVEVDNVLGLIHLFMLLLFAGWGIFFLYTLIRFRKSKNPTGDYAGVKSPFSSYVEVGIVIIEAVLLIGFAFPLWSKRVDAFPPAEQSTVVRVIGEQFAWNVHYPGSDGIFGKRDINLVSSGNPLGLDWEDPYAKDDITTINQLHLPVNKTAIIHLSSKDVIHSFTLRNMRVTQDAIPGMSIPVWFKPVKQGQYDIACAQLCGLGHYRMRGFLTIESEGEFNAWLVEQAAFAASAGAADASLYD